MVIPFSFVSAYIKWQKKQQLKMVVLATSDFFAVFILKKYTCPLHMSSSCHFEVPVASIQFKSCLIFIQFISPLILTLILTPQPLFLSFYWMQLLAAVKIIFYLWRGFHKFVIFLFEAH